MLAILQQTVLPNWHTKLRTCMPDSWRRPTGALPCASFQAESGDLKLLRQPSHLARKDEGQHARQLAQANLRPGTASGAR